jgi:hypothetical protein
MNSMTSQILAEEKLIPAVYQAMGQLSLNEAEYTSIKAQVFMFMYGSKEAGTNIVDLLHTALDKHKASQASCEAVAQIKASFEALNKVEGK